MSQQFDCKTQGCGLKVNYQRQARPGGLGALSRRDATPPTATPLAVYLTCANGHVHRYDVTRAAPHGR